MSMPLSLLAGCGLGCVVGVAYFAALWQTVRRVALSPDPRRLLRRSRAMRFVAILAVMAWVVRCDPVMFLAMVPGLLVGRSLVCHRVVHPPGEATNAS
jgi:F1F0 ATPase subunit 2